MKISYILCVLISLNSMSSWADSDKYEKCAIDLCGPASDYSRVLARGSFSNANNESKASITAKLEPLLNQALETEQINKLVIQKMADRYLKDDKVAMTDEQRSFLTATAVLNVLSPVAEDVLKSSDGVVYQVDLEKLKAKLPKLSAADAVLVSNVGNAVFAEDYFQAAMNLDGYNYEDLIKFWGSGIKGSDL